MSGGRPIRVLVVAAFPVQYSTPQFVRYTQDARLDITVAYCSLPGIEPGVDPGFGIEVRWDIPLLDGYQWVHPADRSPRWIQRMIGAFNPGIWRVVREGRFDVVVCYGYRSATQWIAAMATRSAGSKLVWTTDATTLRSRPGTVGQSWKPILKRVVLPVLFRSGDAVFAPSTKTADFVRTIGVEANRVFVTPFVVDNDFFERGARDADPAALRGAWGVPQEAFVALFSGKLVRWKRPVDMLDAATRVPGLFAVFAGDGELRSVLERRARVLGVTDRVRMLGFVNQTHLPATYRAADVLVLPSEFEPFGVVVMRPLRRGRQPLRPPFVVLRGISCGTMRRASPTLAETWQHSPHIFDGLHQTLSLGIGAPGVPDCVSPSGVRPTTPRRSPPRSSGSLVNGRECPELIRSGIPRRDGMVAVRNGRLIGGACGRHCHWGDPTSGAPFAVTDSSNPRIAFLDFRPIPTA